MRSSASSPPTPGLRPPASATPTAIGRCYMRRPTGQGTFRTGPAVVARLVAAGADVNAHSQFSHHTETPLHWAASSDDVAVLDALLDAGADIEATGAVLGGGTPLSDASGFGNWAAARRLVERGASTRLSDAASLGLLDRVEMIFARAPGPDREEITQALWSACNGANSPPRNTSLSMVPTSTGSDGTTRRLLILLRRTPKLNWPAGFERKGRNTPGNCPAR